MYILLELCVLQLNITQNWESLSAIVYIVICLSLVSTDIMWLRQLPVYYFGGT
jgi:hypothetical protein